MIDWVDDLGKDWGRYLRANPTGPGSANSGFPAVSVMGRIREQGSVGAAIRTHVQVIPYRDVPADILQFHRAWQVIDAKSKKIIYVHYAPLCPLREKLAAMGLKRRTYYARLDRSHFALWETLDMQDRVQKVQQMQPGT